MRLYYEKRVQEGKNKMLVINIIRNKVISRVFAAVKRGYSLCEYPELRSIKLLHFYA
jgi:hypothetical protein